jgi:hypothetical protein
MSCNDLAKLIDECNRNMQPTTWQKLKTSASRVMPTRRGTESDIKESPSQLSYSHIAGVLATGRNLIDKLGSKTTAPPKSHDTWAEHVHQKDSHVGRLERRGGAGGLGPHF